MRKEVIFAVLIGLILGSILIYGIYTANKSVQNTNPDNSADISPTPTPSKASLVTITRPQDGTIITSPEATITGQLNQPKDTVLFIITESEEILINPSETGFFEESINLSRGGNFIQISAITNNGQRQDEYLNLVYQLPDSEPEQEDEK